MIIVSERPTIIGKLIHLNPQSYQSPRKIREALDQERPIESRGRSNPPQAAGLPHRYGGRPQLHRERHLLRHEAG